MPGVVIVAILLKLFAQHLPENFEIVINFNSINIIVGLLREISKEICVFVLLKKLFLSLLF